tara:strand:- start:376 stop:612 length:237 start_codon:yes stop_codon:yes gene_type:complete
VALGCSGGELYQVFRLYGQMNNMMKCLGKHNFKKGIFWKLQGNREDYSFKLIEAGDGDILPDKKTQLGYKVLKSIDVR